MNDLPTVSKGVICGNPGELSYGEQPLGELTADSVLIKVHSAPINPSDLSYVAGTYATKRPRGSIGGFEGSGLVIAAGASEGAQGLLNKRVCFISGEVRCGAWGEYVLLGNALSKVFPIPDTVSYEQGANSLINPLTAQGFIHIMETSEQKVVVHAAAASSLGKIFLALCQEKNFTLINIVRRQSQVDTLVALGAEHVINTGEEGWEAKATELFKQLNPQVFFDPLSGESGSKLVSLLPNGSTTYNYGALGGRNYTLSVADTIFKGKTVTGYWLSGSLKDPQLAVKLGQRSFMAMATGLVKTEIAKTFNHEQYQEAIAFQKENSSVGKVLFQNPNF